MQISGRINHTGRKNLKRSEVQIRIDDPLVIPSSFTVEFNLDKKDLPANADIYIEAYHRNTLQRYDFGTVANPITPESTVLDQIDLSGPTLFRVKIVDHSEHASRLLALADRLMPSDDNEEEQKASLMIFRTTPELGQLTWKMSYNEANKPVLCINSKIPQGKDQLLHNPFFQSLIIPAAFREVLMYIIWEKDDNGEADEESWQKQWEDFANDVAPYEMPNEIDQLYGWIDDVVSTFSENHSFCEHLIKRMEVLDND